MDDVYGIIFDIDHFAVHDGPGIRTVIYLKGCPLKCIWCHSPESQSGEPQFLHIADRCRRCEICKKEKCPNEAYVLCGKKISVALLMEEVMQNRVFFESSGGGVTISGGEVLFQREFTEALLKSLHLNNIHTVVETSGMGKSETLQAISPYTDIFYYDIKSLDKNKHIMYTGADNTLILQNLKELASRRKGRGIVLRVPLIPGHNDSIEEVKKIYDFADELKIYEIHLLPYNTSAQAKYKWVDREYLPGNLDRQKEDYLKMLAELADPPIDVKIM